VTTSPAMSNSKLTARLTAQTGEYFGDAILPGGLTDDERRSLHPI